MLARNGRATRCRILQAATQNTPAIPREPETRMRHWFDSRAFEFEIASEFDFQVDEGAEVAASDRDINLAHNKYYEKYWMGGDIQKMLVMFKRCENPHQIRGYLGQTRENWSKVLRMACGRAF